ncbi:hypothetical protein BUALT_Bualt01G0244700 [Buddleja alternifolia]|uniref:Uncharacterized protein n=1 Tax=Buddleja alternifolia TaxID=168488 RepID=A0AAV6Y9U0_9LAMI|nr:hypothetical protein BUALT_Bualt01G0244700 [Buddleja alternifolia]
MSRDAYDPYAFLSPLCGTAAFRLPPPLPGGRPHPDEDLPEDPFGPIPDHLLCKYLCFEPEPSPPRPLPTAAPDLPTKHNTNSLLVNSSSGLLPLLHDPLHSCDVSNTNCLASDQGHPNLQDSVVHEGQCQSAHNFQLCVVNHQASLPSTPEGQQFSAAGELCDEIPNLLLSEIKELALCHEDCGLEENDIQHILSVISTFRNLAFAADFSQKLLRHIKELALWPEGNVLVDNDIKGMASVMKKFRNLAFYTKGRKSTGYESDSPEPPPKKKQRQSQAKSNTVVSSSYVPPCQSSNADAANYSVVDLDDCRSTKRKSKGKENEYQVHSMAYLSSGCSSLVSRKADVEIIDLTDDSPSTRENFNIDALSKFMVVCYLCGDRFASYELTYKRYYSGL